ncbi:MAG: ABC transporter permease [Flavobacteriales bacterium]|nr:ABC transporter permease [Flavobacteriales bacterium]MCW8937713.1 ABC transporter permease [Flavobacteriales bacterium]MCW8968570.1 ABC transporter permease [Flavobacteriales bacterium]MCW8990201.1 ABC transporter permease [Flavobacteriales bacterium]MCW9019919.1 ABC transporter permease [Flavobacteriales bacterium]
MSKQWDIIIQPKRSVLDINLKQLYNYKDLLFLFVKRDVITIYKQTILGPIWFFVQPILTMVIYVFVFGKIANISTDGIPQPLFYLSGIIIWNYFSSCFSLTANTFTGNAGIFGKVFFPRLIVPLSQIISNLIKFFIQFLLFLTVFFYYLSNNTVNPSYLIILLPLLLLIIAGLGLGFGLIFSSLTTKYKDLKFLMQFGVQLLMYATPIIYPLSTIPEKYQFWIKLNPITHIIETFKTAFLGSGQLSTNGLIYACVFTLITLTLGVLIFNKTEQKFMDTV